MRVTSVDFFGNTNGNFLRYAIIVVDDNIVIRGIKLIHRPDGKIMVAMPSRKKIDNTHEDIVHPINSQCREIIETAILSAWEKFPRAVLGK